MTYQEALADLYHRDLTRLLQEIEAFPGDEYLWRTLTGVKNPAGNLVLHLEGNLRQYIGNCLGGVAYQRDREYEFSARAIPITGLAARIRALDPFIPDVVRGLSEAQLDAEFPETMWGGKRINRQFLMHLYGHLNFHLGQIGYLRRILTEGSAVPFVNLEP